MPNSRVGVRAAQRSRHMAVLGVIAAFALGGGLAARAAEPDIWLVQFQLFVPNKYYSSNSGSEQPIQKALNSEREWRRLWSDLEPGFSRDMEQQAPHPMPSIDFKRHTLIVAAMGEKPTGGYSVAIQSITEMPTEMLVSIVELEPGDCGTTLATTRPIALALIPRTIKPVYFDVSRGVGICN